MFSLKNLMKSMSQSLELAGRAKALEVLRAMDKDRLEQYGYSPAALQQGISAWPWRKPEPAAVTELALETPAANEVEHKQAA